MGAIERRRKLPQFKDSKGNIQTLRYIEKKDGLGNLIPNICLKVPTGGGKTLLGVSAVERVNTDYFSKIPGWFYGLFPPKLFIDKP